jgi:hypothetical protein
MNATVAGNLLLLSLLLPLLPDDDDEDDAMRLQYCMDQVAVDCKLIRS